MTNRAVVADTEVISLYDGHFKSSRDRITDPEGATVDALLAAAPNDPFTLSNNVFLLRRQGINTLVDTGAGNTMGDTMGKLPEALALAGLRTNDIHHILLTHLHKDHFGGLVDAAGGAVFSNAELVIHEDEAAFWLDRPADAFSPRARRFVEITNEAVAPYRSRLRLVSDGEVLPGISARLAPGHTPGHTAWILSAPRRQAVFWGDLVHVGALHLPRPQTVMVYDLDPAEAAETRKRFLAWAAEDGVLVASSHLDAPGLGTLAIAGAGYAFTPAT
ncbi:MAG: hypothetical protein RLZ98_3656 [Pseudomonadota bacterium]|jgi:glyoxylase-like metal-dependent hydrolase (beta-lactamase superfamily II)